MNINNISEFEWNDKTYELFQEYVKSFGNEDYAAFNKKIIPNIGKTWGVKLPILRKISKSLLKNKQIEILYSYLKMGNTHEEKLLQGMLVCNIPSDNTIDKFIRIEEYLSVINNWALCDCFVTNLKDFVKKNKITVYEKAKLYIKSDNPWKIRFGLILLNNYFIEKNYIIELYDLISNIKCDNYYVKMGIAWLLSSIYFFDKDNTLNFLKLEKLDKWTKNKTIQKIKESHKVTLEEKKFLNSLK